MKNNDKTGRSLIRAIRGYRPFGLIVALVLLLIVAAVLTPGFFTFSSLSSMLTNNATYAVLAVGILFVLLTGGIDISVGSVLAVSGVTVTRLMVAAPDVPAIVWVAVGIVVGGLCGAVNGLLIGKLHIAPLIVTLGTMYAFRGLSYVISGGKWIFTNQFTAGFLAIAQRNILGLNSIIWWALALLILTGVFLGYTRPGRRLYAIGTSEESAVIAGIRTGNVSVMAYILCGLCAGLAGVLYASNYTLVSADIGNGYEMTAIAICVLGGVSITGGRGRVDGVGIAILLMSVITYLLSLLPGFNVWKESLQGGIILVALLINLFNNRLADKRALEERGKRI